MNEGEGGKTNRGSLILATLQNLYHALILIRGPELILQTRLAGTVQHTLCAVAAVRLC
jgi:hypothetical protein